MILRRVISGGQIGADIAGLRAAIACGLEAGGWMPRGFRTKDGDHPEYEILYGVQETESSTYPPRTAMNVREADATIRIAEDFTTAGELLTLKCCLDQKSPYYSITWNRETFDTEPRELAWWLYELNVETLNVTGNGITELEEPAEEYLIKVFKLVDSYRMWDQKGG